MDRYEQGIRSIVYGISLFTPFYLASGLSELLLTGNTDFTSVDHVVDAGMCSLFYIVCRTAYVELSVLEQKINTYLSRNKKMDYAFNICRGKGRKL